MLDGGGGVEEEETEGCGEVWKWCVLEFAHVWARGGEAWEVDVGWSPPVQYADYVVNEGLGGSAKTYRTNLQIIFALTSYFQCHAASLSLRFRWAS